MEFEKVEIPVINLSLFAKSLNVLKDSFYWLFIPNGLVVPDSLVIVYCENNIIMIESETVKTLGIRLNDYLVNLDKPILVYFNGNLVFNKIIPRSFETAKKSIIEKIDPFLIYSGEIVVSIQKEEIEFKF